MNNCVEKVCSSTTEYTWKMRVYVYELLRRKIVQVANSDVAQNAHKFLW